MNAKDQIKVLNRGFTIIRERDTGMKNDRILVVRKTRTHTNWHNIPTIFKSKASRRRWMDGSLKDEMFIED